MVDITSYLYNNIAVDSVSTRMVANTTINSDNKSKILFFIFVNINISIPFVLVLQSNI